MTGGARTAVPQRTLRASADWSHTLLTQPERVLFRRLAAFLSGFDFDANQSASDDEVERPGAHQLTLLVDDRWWSPTTRGRTRYRLLETVRQYALESSANPARPRRARNSPPRPLHDDGSAARCAGRQ